MTRDIIYYLILKKNRLRLPIDSFVNNEFEKKQNIKIIFFQIVLILSMNFLILRENLTMVF